MKKTNMKIDKTIFYMTGFYSLITLIIGFFLGTIYHSGNKAVPEKQLQVIRDTIYMDSDSITKTVYIDTPSVQNVYTELKKQNIKHPKIVLAQSILETGYYQSNVCKSHNNLFGLMKGNNYHSFSHWKQSVTYYKNHVQSRYKGGDYYSFLSNIGYAEDDEYIKKLKHLV